MPEMLVMERPLTAKEVAVRLGIPLWRVYALAARGDLKSYTVGSTGVLRFKAEDATWDAILKPRQASAASA